MASLQVSQFLPIWVSLNTVYNGKFFGDNFLVDQWIFRDFPLNFQTSPHTSPHTEVSINGGTPWYPQNYPCNLRIFHEIKHPAIGVPPCPISPHIFPNMSRLAGEGPISTPLHCYMPKSSLSPSQHLPAPSNFVKGMR